MADKRGNEFTRVHTSDGRSVPKGLATNRLCIPGATPTVEPDAQVESEVTSAAAAEPGPGAPKDLKNCKGKPFAQCLPDNPQVFEELDASANRSRDTTERVEPRPELEDKPADPIGRHIDGFLAGQGYTFFGRDEWEKPTRSRETTHLAEPAHDDPEDTPPDAA